LHKALGKSPTAGIDEHGNRSCFGQQFAQQLETLWPHLDIHIGDASEVAAGSVEAFDKTDRNRVDRCRKDDRNGRRRRLGRQCRRAAAPRYDHLYLTANQFGRKRRKSAVLIFCPAIFDDDVLALDIAFIFQPLSERVKADRVFVG